MYAGHAETAAAAGQSIRVKTLTVDYLVKKVNWLPEFIKVDVEGAEALVLRGSKKTAAQKKTVFMVEIHSPPELPMLKNAELILEWVDQVGYSAWYMKDAVILSQPEQIAQRGKCHLLLMPKGNAYPEALSKIPQRAPLPNSI